MAILNEPVDNAEYGTRRVWSSPVVGWLVVLALVHTGHALVNSWRATKPVMDSTA